MDDILLLCNISLPCHRNTALTLCVSVLCLVRHVRDHFCHYITKERPVSNAETVLLTGVEAKKQKTVAELERDVKTRRCPDVPTDSVCHDVLTTQMTTLVIKGAEDRTGSISVERAFC